MKASLEEDEAVDLSKKAHQVVRQRGNDYRSVFERWPSECDMVKFHMCACDG